MEELRNQVSRARRRMVMQQFLGVLIWSLFATFLIAVIGVSATKIWALSVSQSIWMWSWLGGAAGVGILTAAIWTLVIRRNALEAALEIDLRFGLKERVSSTLALTDEERETEAGQALISDAVRRVTRIDVRDKFRVKTGWQMLLPLVPAAAVFLVAMFVPDATTRQAEAKAKTKADLEAVRTANEKLKQKILERRKKLKGKALKNAEVLFKQIDTSLGKIDTNKSAASKKKALVQLKDLANKLKQQRDRLTSSQDLKKQLQQLKNLEQGPADKLAKAMKQGDFKQAMKALESLKKQIQNGKLSAKKKEQLVKQLQQMQKQLQQMAQNQKDMKKQLQQQIQQMKQQGNMDAVNRLQQQLDQLTQQDQMMKQMQNMSDKLGQCAKSMKQGKGKQAAQQMAQMMQDFQKLQDDLDQLETLDDIMDELADARDAMNCKNCKGAGCSMCQGMGSRPGQGNGMGPGQGEGERPEEKTDTGSFNSKVGAKPVNGESIVRGYADGPNRAGVSREAVQDLILQNVKKKTNPMANQRLPRDQRDHAQEYFDRFTK